jgi:hypothetical protein
MPTTIPTGSAFAIRCCQAKSCRNRTKQTVLPRQSHLGKFEDQPNPAKDIWPITYLCQQCGKLSVVCADMIHPVIVQKPGQSRLFRYDFSNGQPDSLVRLTIYTEEPKPAQINLEDSTRAIERILKPFGLWKSEYGMPQNVGIEWI